MSVNRLRDAFAYDCWPLRRDWGTVRNLCHRYAQQTDQRLTFRLSREERSTRVRASHPQELIPQETRPRKLKTCDEGSPGQGADMGSVPVPLALRHCETEVGNLEP